MTTDVVTNKNFATVYPPPARTRFWAQVQRALRDVFGVSAKAAKATVQRYRQSIENEAPVAEQILVYHDSPLNVAASLSGTSEITEEHRRLFQEIAGSNEPVTRGTLDDAD